MQGNPIYCIGPQTCGKFIKSYVKMIATIFRMMVNSREEKGEIRLRRGPWSGSNLFIIVDFFY